MRKNCQPGKKIWQKRILIPADTFRAAAGSQLNVLAGKIGVDILKSDLTDSSATIYSGIQNGISDNRDIVIVDTAGRIHIRDDLMEELFKNFKTVKKVLGRRPTWYFW